MKYIIMALSLVILAPTMASAYHNTNNNSSRNISVTTLTEYDTYEEGEDIVITITARNSSSRSKTLYFNSGCQVSYSIQDYRNRTVYDSADDQFCTQALTSVTIPARSSKSWDLTHLSSDYDLVEGDYRITGRVIGYKSSSVWITVEEGNDDSDVTVLAPNGDEEWGIGQRKTIRWEFDDHDMHEVDVRLIPMYPYQAPYTIVQNYDGTLYRWKVGKVKEWRRTPEEGMYKIEVCISDTDICDESDNAFMIY